MTWISTRSGKRIDFVNPDPDQIDIEDIAYALAAIPRWCGQTTIPYNVAHHSWLCSKMCPKHALAALLHDAPEAYMFDCPRPLKTLLGPTWNQIETRLLVAIFGKYGLHPWIPREVKAIDDRLLMTERRDLQPRAPEWEWGRDIEPFSWKIVPRNSDQSRRMFLDRFMFLTHTGAVA